jgi:putative restriction endonuclease
MTDFGEAAPLRFLPGYADYRLHVSDRLLGRNDGPMLEALKGGTIHLPGRIKDRPDQDRLAQRFERFKAVA